jgi:hypothetical protein
MRRWPVFDGGLRPRSGHLLACRHWPVVAGYEPYDARLCRLAYSPVTGLTSMDWGREVAFGRRVSLVSSRPAASGLQIG